jgi:hypothetical protein
VYCSRRCKGDAQRAEKEKRGITRKWLWQKYVIEGLGIYDIGRLVERDPKRVYEWLLGYRIPLRSRHDAVVLMNKRADIRLKRSKSSRGRKARKSTREKLRAARLGIPRFDLRGANNGMFGRRGIRSPAWKGGRTPWRQKLCATRAWKDAVEIVRKRDRNKCKRCGRKQGDLKKSLALHHLRKSRSIRLFADPCNLTTLCPKCHRWVHSTHNTKQEFLR